MARAARRHHRVAKKEVSHSHESGIFIPDRSCNGILIFAVVLVVLVFIKGIIIGAMIANHEE